MEKTDDNVEEVGDLLMNNNSYIIICKESDFNHVIIELQNIVNFYVFNSCSHDSDRIRATNFKNFNEDNVDYVFFELSSWKKFVYSKELSKVKHNTRLRNRTDFLLKELRMLSKVNDVKVFYPSAADEAHAFNLEVSLCSYSNDFDMLHKNFQLVDEDFVSLLQQSMT